MLSRESLPASDAIAGATYKQVGFGVVSTTGFTWQHGVHIPARWRAAETSLAATANIALTATQTNLQWKIEALLNFLTPTTAECIIEIVVNSAPGGGGAANDYLVASTAAVTVSLATAKTWVVDVTPGATGNSIQALGGWSERVC